MKYLLTLLTLLVLSGCGDTSEPATVESSTIEMQLNKSYEVKKGDQLIKSAPETKVSIEKSLDGEKTTVTLLEGSAQIILTH